MSSEQWNPTGRKGSTWIPGSSLPPPEEPEEPEEPETPEETY